MAEKWSITERNGAIWLMSRCKCADLCEWTEIPVLRDPRKRTRPGLSLPLNLQYTPVL